MKVNLPNVNMPNVLCSLWEKKNRNTISGSGAYEYISWIGLAVGASTEAGWTDMYTFQLSMRLMNISWIGPAVGGVYWSGMLNKVNPGT